MSRDIRKGFTLRRLRCNFACLDAMWHFVGIHVLEGGILHEVADDISLEYDLQGANHTKHL